MLSINYSGLLTKTMEVLIIIFLFQFVSCRLEIVNTPMLISFIFVVVVCPSSIFFVFVFAIMFTIYCISVSR